MPGGLKSAQGLQTVSRLYNPKRLLRYTPEEIDHCESSQTIRKFVTAKRIQSKNTGTTYKTRIQSFSQFIYTKFDKMEADQFIESLGSVGFVSDSAGIKHDPYDVLTNFSGFLRGMKGISGKHLSANHIRACVKTIRKFFRYNKIKVTIEEFEEMVPLPRKERPEKTPVDKNDVCRYLNGSKNIQMKTMLHLLAAVGCRPIEACAVREADIDLETKPGTIRFSSEFSKMRVARTRPLTEEAANQFSLWLSFKYRTRRTTIKDENGKYVQKVVTPSPDANSLFLAMPRFTGKVSTPEGLYDHLAQ